MFIFVKYFAAESSIIFQLKTSRDDLWRHVFCLVRKKEQLHQTRIIKCLIKRNIKPQHMLLLPHQRKFECNFHAIIFPSVHWQNWTEWFYFLQLMFFPFRLDYIKRILDMNLPWILSYRVIHIIPPTCLVISYL